MRFSWPWRKAVRRAEPMRISEEALAQLGPDLARAQERPAIPFAESPEFHQFMAEAAQRRASALSEMKR